MAVVITLAACQHKTVPADSSNASPLENTHWKLTYLTTIPSGLPTLSKEAFLQLIDGSANGSAGCNSFFGSYTLSGSQLRFTGVGSTKMFCQQGMDVETGFLQALNNADNFRITGKRLELLRGTVMVARFETQ